MSFGDNLRRLRTARNLSQAELANQFGLLRNTVSNYESGKTYPTFDLLGQLVKFFDVTADELLGLTAEFTVQGSPKGSLKGSPTAAVQNEKDKKTETPTESEGTFLKLAIHHAGKSSDAERDYITGASLAVRPVVVAVDDHDEGRITMVAEDVYAGYLRGYADPEYVGTLPTFNVPTLPRGRTYRAFQVRGDSMVPTLHPHDVIVCSYQDDWRHLRNDQVYVIVSAQEGLVVKRITNHIAHRRNPHIICTSDNSDYPPFHLAATPDQISELWQVELRMTRYLLPPPPAPELAQRVTILEMQYQDLMERIQPAQKALEGSLFDD